LKVGIVEYHYHEEYLNTLIQLFPDSDVYTTKQCYDNLPEEAKDKANFIFKHSKQRTKDFIQSIDTNYFDYLFVNTIQPSMIDLPNWKDFKPKCKTILTIHNLNAWISRNKFIPRKNILHSFDSYFSGNYTGRILGKFELVSFVYKPIFDYVSNTPKVRTYLPPTLLNIPYSLTLDTIKEDKKDTIDFVIPGIVDNKRRNYEQILSGFYPGYEKARLILLGKNKENIKGSEWIKTFDERIPTETYDKYLQNSDVVICPSLPTTHTISAAEEIYGTTKSPNIFESIKWRKPLMIPSYIALDPQLKSSTLQYNSSQSFYQQVLQLLENPDLLADLKKQAFNNTKHFTLPVVKKQLERLLSM